MVPHLVDEARVLRAALPAAETDDHAVAERLQRADECDGRPVVPEQEHGGRPLDRAGGGKIGTFGHEPQAGLRRFLCN